MHPDRMPSINLGVLIPTGAAYDTQHHWRTDAGQLRASVAFQGGGYSRGHLQGGGQAETARPAVGVVAS